MSRQSSGFNVKIFSVIIYNTENKLACLSLSGATNIQHKGLICDTQHNNTQYRVPLC